MDRFSFPGGACSFVEQIDGEATPAKGTEGEDVAFDRALRRLFVADYNAGGVDVFEVGAGEHYRSRLRAWDVRAGWRSMKRRVWCM